MKTGLAIFRILMVGGIVVSIGATCRQVHPEKAPSGIIEGVVTDSVSGEMIMNASVLVAGTKTGATTGSSGHFWIKGVPPGTHDLLAAEVDHERKELKDIIVRAHEVTQVSIRMVENKRDMSHDPDVRPVEIKGKKYGGIQGEVWNTGNVMFEPIGGALVALDGTKLGARADEFGRFHFKHILPGLYQLAINAIPYEQTTKTVRVVAGETTRLRVELEEIPADLHHDPETMEDSNQEHGCIKGEVVDSLTSWPIIGAYVSAGGAGSGVLTDLDGKFLIKRAATGKQNVCVTDMRYSVSKVVEAIVVRANKTTRIKVVLGAKRNETK
jgi:hypothetical protein